MQRLAGWTAPRVDESARRHARVTAPRRNERAFHVFCLIFLIAADSILRMAPPRWRTRASSSLDHRATENRFDDASPLTLL